MEQGSGVTLKQRCAGILLHPTSLPGSGSAGELGEDALRFVDFLVDAGQSIWQVLPLVPVHENLSPYQSSAAFAGNPKLLGRQWLLQDLPEHLHGEAQQLERQQLIALHHQWLQQNVNEQKAFLEFCQQQQHWLDDYAMFRVLQQDFEGSPWHEWPESFRDRHTTALNSLQDEAAEQLDYYRTEQFLFYRQWLRVRRYANERGITILGDMPVFVAYDSADVWANRCAFQLDDSGKPNVVAGVPPDYFSATGQLWGNPHYNWEWMRGNDFQWWHRRVAQQLELYDMFRIDHFRGFEACWAIPADEETAINGEWIKVPGDELFASLQNEFGELPILAEDLGIITPEVTALRQKFHFPGMLILQFAFDGQGDNPYLPHNHLEDSVVYTGTHDNDTTLGWFESLPDWKQHKVLEYYHFPTEPIPWPLIESAYSSVAQQAIIPMQDVLSLGSEHRMNVPGVAEGNWQWRFQWRDLPEGIRGNLHHLSQCYQRTST